MREENIEEASAPAPKKGIGCGGIIAIFLMAFILLGLGLNEAAGYYYTHCQDKDVFECFTKLNKESTEEEEEGTTARGTYSYKDYSAEFILNFPLTGGNVTGTITGTCTGSVTNGTYDGSENGIITGSMSGYCDPFFIKIPAKGSFVGNVQKDSKKVFLKIEGSGGGFEKQDTMTLTY